ncbi:MAG: heavy metal translocating P-type ATPase [Clostridia bacterium]|nr:heavy metal translocating P-type ATPase [Clostridia bacterium]
MKKKFTVSGMTCAACSAHVQKAVSALDGVDKCEVSLLGNCMTVECHDITDEQIIECVKKSGYGASEYQLSASKDGQNIQSLRRRLVWSAILLVPLFYVTMLAMLGAPLPFFMKGHYKWINVLLQITLVVPIMIINHKYFSVGFKRLFSASPNMDSLIAIGSSASFLYGLFAFGQIIAGTVSRDWDLVHKYGMNLYFDSAGMILTLVTLGKYFEGKSRGKTGDAIEKLINLAPKIATVVVDGVEIQKETSNIEVGDIIRIRPGESIPVDGKITYGGSAIDQSAITGESIPVYKTVGDKVASGSVNTTGAFLYVAQKAYQDSTLSQIIRLVEEAGSSKAPIARLADKVSGIFVPAVIFIAVVTFVTWLLVGKGYEFALSMAISVLVISCPCALGLATPVAIMVGTGKGAENGILIKSAESFEQLSKVGAVVLDKTGTITAGKPTVTEIIALADENELLTYALTLEQNSQHPLATAVVDYCEKRGIKPLQPQDFLSYVSGVEARINDRRCLCGNTAFMEERGVNVPDAEISRLAEQGKTPLCFAMDGDLVGIIAVRDEIKPTSARAIQEFHDMGIEVVMMTGDNELTAKAIASEMKIDRVLAGVLPQNKEQEVARIMEGKITAMVGDGINDAPALTRSDVGIAVGAGTDVAIDSADIVLMRSDLMDAVTATKLSKRVMKIIKMNLFFAFIYNIIGIPIAAGAFYYLLGLKLSPMLGAAAMSMSSVCVVSNALRIRNFSPNGKNSNKFVKNANNNKKIIKEKNMEKTFVVKGMMCEHCKARVEKALNAIEGVSVEKINLKKKTVTVSVNDLVTQDMISTAISAAGYEAEF